MTTDYKFEQLVNEDGSPTADFMALWKADKEEVKANNLFLGKEGGRWVVKPGRPRFKACHGSSTVANGNCYTLDQAQQLLDRRLAAFAKTYSGDELARIAGDLNVRVEYERPRFGTPEERAERRATWEQYAEARRTERLHKDYRPSRWELNYNPKPEEDEA